MPLPDFDTLAPAAGVPDFESLRPAAPDFETLRPFEAVPRETPGGPPPGFRTLGEDLTRTQELETPEPIARTVAGQNPTRQILGAIRIPFTKLTPKAKTVQDALDALASSSPELTQEEAERLTDYPHPPDTTAKVIAGGLGAANRALEGSTTLPNLALLAATGGLGPVGQRLASGGFALEMGGQLPELYKRVQEAIKGGDPEEISGALGDLGLTGLFTLGAGGHAILPRPKPLGPTGKRLPRPTPPPSPTVPPADVSRSALQELEAAMRANQLKPKGGENEPPIQPTTDEGRSVEPEPTSGTPPAAGGNAPPAEPLPERPAGPGAQAPETAPGVEGGGHREPLTRTEFGPAAEVNADLVLEMKKHGAIGRTEWENYSERLAPGAKTDAERAAAIADAYRNSPGELGNVAAKIESYSRVTGPGRAIDVSLTETGQEPAQPLQLTQSAGEETITGPATAAAVPGNERVGSEIPAEREERLTRPTPSRRAPERPPDILDALEGNVGRIDPRLIREAAPDWKPIGAARKLFKVGGVPADSALHAITQAGQENFGASADMGMDEFGDMLNAAANARKAGRERAASERRQLDEQAKAAMAEGLKREQFENRALQGERPKTGPATAQVPVDSFVVGDRFKVQDHTFKVSDLELDEDGNLLSVTVEDGPKFGVQKVGAQEVIHVDEGTLRRNRKARAQAGEFLPEQGAPPPERPALEMAKPESVAEQEASAVKEPWQMTREEWYSAKQNDRAETFDTRNKKSGAADTIARIARKERLNYGVEGDIEDGVRQPVDHKQVIEKALSEGKPVPAEVLEAYPDLKSKSDRVEAALDRLKIDTSPDQLHAFGIVPELWNGLIETVRLAYRAGRSITQAVQDGLDWLRRAHPEARVDEAAAREYLESELARVGEGILPETHHGLSPERMAELAEEARTLRRRRAGGEELSPEQQDRLEQITSLVDEAIHAARQPRGGIPRRTEEPPPPEPPPPPRPPRPRPRYANTDRLPAGTLRDLWRGMQRQRQALSDWWARGDLRKDITRERDVAENRAGLVANAAAGHINVALNRALGAPAGKVRARNDLWRMALNLAVEAHGDPQALSRRADALADSEFADSLWSRRALRAADFALNHWDELAPVVEEYARLSDIQREEELGGGINSNEWEGGYVFHQWKHSPAGGGVDPNAPSAAATPFTKARTTPDYLTGLAQGGVPRSLDAVELLSARINAGQKRLNELAWVHALRGVEDPIDHDPLVTDVIRRPMRPISARGGEEVPFEESAPAQWQSTAPAGYEVQRLGDLEYAVKRGFGGLITDLTSRSWLEGSPARRLAKRAFGFSKSVLLMFDTFHLGRIALWASSLTGRPTYGKGATLLDYTPADIMEMARRGEIPQSWAEGLLENKRRLDLAVRSGFNVGQILDNTASDWLHNIPGIGHFNKWLFGQYQRGAMAQAWLIEFERLKRANPTESETLLAQHVSRDLNARFGNLGRQGLFRTKTAQDIARLVFLAPQWNESLIRSEVGAVGQAFKGAYDLATKRRIIMGSLLKSTGTLALGTFLANQILNYATRGKPTWENEEEGWDHKISAWIPDVIGNGPGFFLNPLALPAEYTHLISGQLERSKDTADALWRIANSRLASPTRAALMLATRKDALGRSLKPGEVLPALGEALIPAPLAGSALAAAGKQLVTGEPSERYPGQFEKQALSTFGIKTDQAPTPEQRVRRLAREFNAAKGVVPSAEFFAGDYDDLTRALRIGNKSDAAREMQDLLAKKTREQILKHFTTWVSAPYTGQRAREAEFFRGLDAGQRAAYIKSRETRRELARQAYQLLRATPVLTR